MEGGSEISQKIRYAIKAKLVELGAYVDDELPEYIMVMVANKRSRTQMNNDLCLFLGDNTDSFTIWLHSLLLKLQTIKNDSDTSVDKQVKAERLAAIKEKRKGKKLQKGDQIGKNNNKVDNKDKKKNDTHHCVDGVITKRQVTSYENDRNDTTEETQPGSGNSEDIQHRTDSNETANKNTDLNYLSKEKQIYATSKNIEENVNDIRHLLVTESSQDALNEQLETTDSEFVNSRTIGALGVVANPTVLKNVETGAVTVCQFTTKNLSSPDRHLQSLTVVRKRKASTSVLDASEDVEEAYDPYNPAVGSVTNLVKITKRRSSVPASLQTNRQTDNSVFEGRMHSSQTFLQEGQPQHKLIKLSNTVHLEDIKQALTEVLEKTQARTDDVAHFSRMLELSLRKLHPQDLALAKLRIQQVLFEFESVKTQGNLEIQQKNNTLKQLSNPTEMADTCLDTLGKESGVKSVDSLNIVLPGNKHTTLSNSLCGTLREQKESHNLETDHNHSVVSNLVDETGSRRLQRTSGSIENHVTTNYKCLNSERGNSEGNDYHIDRVIFHPKSSMDLLKSSSFETTDLHSRTHVKSRERESAEVKPQGDQPPQSPVSLSKADMGSSSSAHSSPLGSTSGLTVKRHVTSASRESTLSPLDLQSKPGTSHIHKYKLASAGHKLSPSILVDSIHSRKRPESTESASVLRQNWQRDKSPRAAEPTKNDTQDSPRHYGPEALKVMAKNLRITVINKQALKPLHESSSDDSDDDDEDIDSSDDDDDEEDEEKDSDSTEKIKADAGLKKATSGPSTP